MSLVSVLTLMKDRTAHLEQMLEGLRRGDAQPGELIIVDMNQTPAKLSQTEFPVHRLHLPADGLPLARARNLAAFNARHDILMFLDADCIPMRGLIGALQSHLTAQDILICPEVCYLAHNEARGAWNEEELRQTASKHPARRFPDNGLIACDHPGLFWSLAFGIRRERYIRMGGFDEAFTGYGAEDTDFGFRAHRQNLPLAFLGGITAGTGAFHQHHPVYDPPLQHFADILRNAHLFRERWNVWPMQGWLTRFSEMGLITLTGDTLTIQRQPTPDEITAAKSIEGRF